MACGARLRFPTLVHLSGPFGGEVYVASFSRNLIAWPSAIFKVAEMSYAPMAVACVASI